MLTFCFDGGLDGFALMAVRVSIVGVSIYGLCLMWKIAKFQRKNPTRVHLVSTLLIVGAASWLALQLVITSYLLTTDCSTTLSPSTRTLYGNALVWSQASLAVMIAHGLKYRVMVWSHVQAAPTDEITSSAIEHSISNLDGSDQDIIRQRLKEGHDG